MRVPRIHVDQPLVACTTLRLPEAPSRHLTQVLRLGRDAALILFDGTGVDHPARLVEVERAGVWVAVEAPGPAEPPPPLELHLALGISKGDRMDYAIQKSVELGVTRITPLFTERSQVQLAGPRLERRLEHWRGVVIGACEQSGRRRPPELCAAKRYLDWIDSHQGAGLLLDPSAEQALASLPEPSARALTLLVGPEGGLAPREREQARARDFIGVRLGPRILRTETAPLVALAILQARWGDLGD